MIGYDPQLLLTDQRSPEQKFVDTVYADWLYRTINDERRFMAFPQGMNFHKGGLVRLPRRDVIDRETVVPLNDPRVRTVRLSRVVTTEAPTYHVEIKASSLTAEHIETARRQLRAYIEGAILGEIYKGKDDKK